MYTVIHETPGLIDLSSLKTFGINAKPNSVNPIGYFGTGLKYAIAILVREGLKVTIWRGNEPYIFYCENKVFRDKTFSQIYLKRQRGATARWFKEELPFTTELGKTWALWQALRELHSNTIDENGNSWCAKMPLEPNHLHKINKTLIIVEGKSYYDEFMGMDKIFLKREILDSTFQVQIFHPEELSPYVYYRGLRAHSLSKGSIFLYNINTLLELTEDRTVKYGFMVDYYIKRHIMSLKDLDILKEILLAKESTYEYSITWSKDDKSYASPEFLEAVKQWGRKETFVFIEHEKKVDKELNWQRRLIIALEQEEREEILSLMLRYKSHIVPILEQAIKREQELLTPLESFVENTPSTIDLQDLPEILEDSDMPF